MITKAPSFVTSDSQTFLTLEAAQGHELKRLWVSDGTKIDDRQEPADTIPEWIWNNREKIVEILTLTPTSRPRARKANGASRKRKAAVATLELPGTGKE